MRLGLTIEREGDSGERKREREVIGEREIFEEWGRKRDVLVKRERDV